MLKNSRILVDFHATSLSYGIRYTWKEYYRRTIVDFEETENNMNQEEGSLEEDEEDLETDQPGTEDEREEAFSTSGNSVNHSRYRPIDQTNPS